MFTTIDAMFSSYLSERKQFVLFKGKQSEQTEIITGVPLGSILGPLFIIVFMNDMPMSTRTICNVDMYADGSTISACGKNVQEIELKLNNDLQEISIWCDENRMVVIVEKSKIMIVTTRQNDNTSTKRTLTYASREIYSKWSTMRGYLGFMLCIYIPSSPGRYIYIYNRIAGKLALQWRIKQYLPYKARKTFYNSYILPHMDYAAQSGSMQQHQIASTNSNDVLPE